MDDLVALVAEKDVNGFLRRMFLHWRSVHPCRFETQLQDVTLSMDTTTAHPPAVDKNVVVAMNREAWVGGMLEAQERAMGYAPQLYHMYRDDGSLVTHSPEPASVGAEQYLHSPHQHLGGPCHDVGTYSAFDNSPFCDLDNDPVATADATHEEQESHNIDSHAARDDADEQYQKPAAQPNERNHKRDSSATGSFVGATESTFSVIQANEDSENKLHTYDEYDALPKAERLPLSQYAMQDAMPTPGYAISHFRPEYSSPVGSYGMYPPPPPRYPIEYRLGGNEVFEHVPPMFAEDIRQSDSREPPLGTLPTPLNARRGAARQRAAALKKKQLAKPPSKPNEDNVTRVTQRLPSSKELEDAKTPRAKAALIVWYQRLSDLIAYKELWGDCAVPQKYSLNPALGIWVNKQRMEAKFKQEGLKSSMTAAKQQALNDIGFSWAKRKGQPSWDTRFAQLQEYAQQNGHCRVPTKFAENPALGRWVSTQRSQFKQYQDNQPTHMTLERMRLLESIGFKWNAMERDEETEHKS
ncbi:hypothetical protein MPSEU_000038500 [Mayamaea pseudoterrestris]|nr:hypothetical protein MPSEU_000038500 [Mayamaea pseudoterrestris]